MLRTLWEVIKGWTYLLLFITGGNFVRKARLARCGSQGKISPTVFFKFPENIEVGTHVFINHQCSIWASPGARIFIGDDVLFGPGVTVVTANHGTAAGTLIRLQAESEADVRIGNDVWIGAHAVITPGVSLGDGCVIAAAAVVTRDMPPQSICAGVPAKVIGYRNSTPTSDLTQ